MFKQYTHLERFGTDAVQGIELGECTLFPKLDGTNASVWSLDVNGARYLRAGSRTRELSLSNDNAGFYGAVHKDERLLRWVCEFPHLRLYGEWLVPHTLKTYRDDAWRKFWVFDVYNDASETFVRYEDYKPLLDEFNLDYIPPLAHIKNGTYDNFIHVLKENRFFIQEGKGIGEGIVVKNYSFYNKFGNQTWAKIVTSEFKEQNHREMGAPSTEKRLLEEELAETYVTRAEVEKTIAKIKVETDGWSSKSIPRLLDTVYHDVVQENTWDILKKHKNPTINFQTLKHFVINQIKQLSPEIFT